MTQTSENTAGTPATPAKSARLLADHPIESVLELVSRFDTRGPRYTSYPTVPVWKTELPETAFDDALAQVKAGGRPVAVYVHLPFCKQRCLYCGCNSFITQSEDRITRYVRALETEIAQLGERLDGAVKHEHLHLGGGTPTYLPPAQLAGMLDALIGTIGGVATAERSVEVDPRTCTDEHLAVLAERGFNRVSAGVQDIEPEVQAAVRRVQPFEMVRDFVDRARAHGFESVNVDLMYGLPHQSPDSWERTLEAILGLGPDRLACFGYAHLPQRIKHQRALPAEALPSAETRLRMLLAANNFFTEHGYEAIGMDHFARPDDELAKARRDGRLWRNFMGYTTTRGLELLAVGCSSISETERLFCQNEGAPERYAELVEAGDNLLVRGHQLDDDDRYRKALISDLMCNLEIRPQALGAEMGIEVPDEVSRALESLRPYEDAGVIQPIADGYQITPLGQLFLRNLAMPFDRYLSQQAGTVFSKTV